MDRSAPRNMGGFYSPSPWLYFTNWEGDESSLRSHFGALRSKILDIYCCKSISIPSCLIWLSTIAHSQKLQSNRPPWNWFDRIPRLGNREGSSQALQLSGTDFSLLPPRRSFEIKARHT